MPMGNLDRTRRLTNSFSQPSRTEQQAHVQGPGQPGGTSSKKRFMSNTVRGLNVEKEKKGNNMNYANPDGNSNLSGPLSKSPLLLRCACVFPSNLSYR